MKETTLTEAQLKEAMDVLNSDESSRKSMIEFLGGTVAKPAEAAPAEPEAQSRTKDISNYLPDNQNKQMAAMVMPDLTGVSAEARAKGQERLKGMLPDNLAKQAAGIVMPQELGGARKMA